MDGELGDDVCQQQVATVLAGRVHTGFGKQTGPGEGHEAAQLTVAVLVVVVDVVWRVFHKQCGKLQQVDPQRVQHVCLLLGVQHLPWRELVVLSRSPYMHPTPIPTPMMQSSCYHLGDEQTGDTFRVVAFRIGWPQELLSFPLLKAV